MISYNHKFLTFLLLIENAIEPRYRLDCSVLLVAYFLQKDLAQRLEVWHGATVLNVDKRLENGIPNVSAKVARNIVTQSVSQRSFTHDHIGAEQERMECGGQTEEISLV